MALQELTNVGTAAMRSIPIHTFFHHGQEGTCNKCIAIVYTTVRTYQKWNLRARQPCTWNFEIIVSYNMFQHVSKLHCIALCVHWLRMLMCM